MRKEMRRLKVAWENGEKGRGVQEKPAFITSSTSQRVLSECRQLKSNFCVCWESGIRLKSCGGAGNGKAT